MKVKEDSEKVGLKLNIHKTKIIALGPITSWQIDGETMETVRDFILGDSKITADGDYSHEIKRHLLLGRKVMTNLDITLKSKNIILPTKVHLVKAMVFPVVMYGCESWDCKESWAPKNWCVVLEKTLESFLDCKEIQPVHSKGNQSWIFIGRTMLKLKLQYFGHLMWRADSQEKTLMLGFPKFIEGGRRGQQRMRWLMASPTPWTWVWISPGSWWWTGKPGVLQSMGLQRVGHNWTTELNWTNICGKFIMNNIKHTHIIRITSLQLSNKKFFLQIIIICMLIRKYKQM